MRFLVLLFAAVALTSCAVTREIGILQDRHIVRSTDDGVHPALVTEQREDVEFVQFHGHEITSVDVRRFKDSRFKGIRVDLAWGAFVELSRESYDWTHLDTLYRAVQDKDGRLVIILNYGNPNLYDGLRLEPKTWDDEKFAAWERVIDLVSTRYDSDDVILEIWNEPDNDDFWSGRGAEPEEYVEFARRTAAAARRNNPDVCLLGPASAGFEVDWVQECIERGLLEYIDGVSVHPYRKYPKRPESIVDELRDLQRAIYRNNDTGRTIPIVFTEWGYGMSNTDGPDEYSKIAELFTEMMDVTYEYGVSFCVWYEWRGKQRSALLGERTYKPSELYNELH